MRYILSVLVALAIIMGLLLLYRAVQRYELRQQPLEETQIALRLENSQIVARSAGRRQWSLRAERIDLYSQPGRPIENYDSVEFIGIRDGVLYRHNRPEAFFRAERALFSQPLSSFDIRGHILLRSIHGDLLQAEACTWSERDAFVRFPQGARAQFGDNEIQAPLLLYAPQKNEVQCPQGAVGSFLQQKLQAGNLTWDVARGIVRCSGTVTGTRKNAIFSAQQAELNLKAHTLTANKVSLHLRIEDEAGRAWEATP